MRTLELQQQQQFEAYADVWYIWVSFAFQGSLDGWRGVGDGGSDSWTFVDRMISGACVRRIECVSMLEANVSRSLPFGPILAIHRHFLNP